MLLLFFSEFWGQTLTLKFYIMKIFLRKLRLVTHALHNLLFYLRTPPLSQTCLDFPRMREEPPSRLSDGFICVKNRRGKKNKINSN